jgi:hypothetical protein
MWGWLAAGVAAGAAVGYRRCPPFTRQWRVANPPQVYQPAPQPPQAALKSDNKLT